MPTLHDGRQVPSDSNDWKLECLAHHILSLPSLEVRRAWLCTYEKRRGEAAANELRAMLLSLHSAKVRT